MSQTINDLQDLTKLQRQLLVRIEQDTLFTERFYLTGGTLLKALGIVPRQSNDLDFFTFSTVNADDFMSSLTHVKNLLEKLFGTDSITPTDRGFLHTASNMVIDIVADSSPNIDEFVLFGNLHTASLKDLAAHKASALCSRDEVKDYIDIAYLTKHQGWLLKDLAQLAEKKFHLGTISEEKLLTELLAKREAFTIPLEIFLRSPEENSKRVDQQIQHLLETTSL